MFFTESITSQIDDILNRIGESLQLDLTRRKSAEERYAAVSNLLNADKSFWGKYDLNIYPHGSFAINTTVKPIQGDYDLDFVLQIKDLWINYNPVIVLSKLNETLQNSGRYKGMIERKNRCIRINYANDFHMDIIPAFYDKSKNDYFLKIPNQDSAAWSDTNPKGYFEWFESTYLKEEYIFEKAAKIEDLPVSKPYDVLQPIQRAVQLIKRFRDIYFIDNEDHRTSSIIITTLSGEFYKGEGSEYLAIKNILESILNKINRNRSPFEVLNPSLPSENFSEKWINEPNLYFHFKKFINDFYLAWEELGKTRGLFILKDKLGKLFGEYAEKAIDEQASTIRKLKDNSILGIKKETGILTSYLVKDNSIKSEHNNFYGKENK